jgi:transcription elongation factor Elf1
MSLEFVTLHCPYCGESFDSSVDLSGGEQTYTEDCAVCCRPIVVSVTLDDADGLGAISTRREQD